MSKSKEEPCNAIEGSVGTASLRGKNIREERTQKSEWRHARRGHSRSPPSVPLIYDGVITAWVKMCMSETNEIAKKRYESCANITHTPNEIFAQKAANAKEVPCSTFPVLSTV